MADDAPSDLTRNARKRPRTDVDSPAATKLIECTRSPTFWYTGEGSIILRVDDTLFRVHRDMLSAHFAVFKDVFTVPQPVDSDQLNGCQAMTQSGDQREDWETALAFIYQPLNMNPWHNELTAKQLCSLIRLAHKYQGDQLFQECVKRLKSEFPMLLVIFQEMYLKTRSRPTKVHGRASLAQDLHGLIHIINTAVELEIECVLPCAYILLSICYEPSVVLSPPLDSEGGKVSLNPSAMHFFVLASSQIYPALLQSVTRWIQPDHGDWQWFCREAHAAYIGHCQDEEGFEAEEPPQCQRDFNAIRNSFMAHILHPATSKLFFLAPWLPGSICARVFRGVCDGCQSEEARIRQAALLKFWTGMPKAFGIGDRWNALKFYKDS